MLHGWLEVLKSASSKVTARGVGELKTLTSGDCAGLAQHKTALHCGALDLQGLPRLVAASASKATDAVAFKDKLKESDAAILGGSTAWALE